MMSVTCGVLGDRGDDDRRGVDVDALETVDAG
jgi:hypothetical protein